MRHNSGEDIKGTNPDQNPSVRELHGFLLPMGTCLLVATQYMYDGALANWNSSKAPSGSWVDGTKRMIRVQMVTEYLPAQNLMICLVIRIKAI